ncbi:Protein-L-isoaspartate(D-aspartate) O-methyltransferase [Zancudomyces culisetae]|uniref:protein-L-isoaspartate(D-aspartate) O-methyltransferase n=1 Tax=Zancudomyces culisetae TaxID=1213189 RepID=A0A1R1PXV7_ZANCU|nr:Protein-L-isoaspartate(D-aspartate) O-methyltransferase [Zancudomyces culisetae]|eukprot:OMH85769.1 Protein-L-isoaspartate(D-aspartate) O-methyltransferase [Zancudomyces culisetae]
MRMAWRCSASPNLLSKADGFMKRNLVASFTTIFYRATPYAGIIHSPRVVAAMMEIDRGEYSKYAPYEDSPQGIGYGATISAPHMHGYALEYLSKYLHEGANVLDVGSGSGYLTAYIEWGKEGRIIFFFEYGHVVGIDHVPELVQNSIRDTKKSHPEWLTQNRLKFVSGDGRLGYKKDAPYDCIQLFNLVEYSRNVNSRHVGAASPNEPIEVVLDLYR